MNTSEKIDELAKALIAVQGELKPAPKKSENPFFKSTYADLTTIIETASPILTKHGLAVSQVCENGGSITTVLLHSSGQFIAGTVTLTPSKNDPQGIGSALTYARRYGYASIIGLATEDDDGNEASKPVEKPASKPVTAKPKKSPVDNAIEKIDEAMFPADVIAVKNKAESYASQGKLTEKELGFINTEADKKIKLLEAKGGQ